MTLTRAAKNTCGRNDLPLVFERRIVLRFPSHNASTYELGRPFCLAPSTVPATGAWVTPPMSVHYRRRNAGSCGGGLPVSGKRYFEAGGDQGLTLSVVGKFSGIFWVTRPVAVHSVPRSSVTTKPTSCIDSSLWPSAVWNTRP